MNLADKPCYPITLTNFTEVKHSGLTFRQRLIIALASNPATLTETTSRGFEHSDPDTNAKYIISQADAIIKQLEGEKK